MDPETGKLNEIRKGIINYSGNMVNGGNKK